jgi:PAS domain S-box-containing protein
MISTIIIMLGANIRDYETAVFFVKILNLFGDGAGTLALMVMFALYTGNRFFSKPSVVALFAIVPVISVYFRLTGNLFHYDFLMFSVNGWRIIDFKQGYWHQIHQMYIFTISAVNLSMIVKFMGESRKQNMTSNVMLIFFSIGYFLIAFIHYFVIASDIKPINYLPYAWTVPCIIAMAALLMSRSSELIPMALREAVEGTDDIMLILNRTDKVIDCNSAAADALGMKKKGLIGQQAVEVFQGWGELPDLISRHTEDGIKLRLEHVSEEKTHILTITVIRDDSGVIEGRLISLKDITDIEIRERAKKREEQLHGLTRKIIAAQEDERNRLAREIHDDFGHKYLTLSLNIETIRRRNLLPETEINGLSSLVRDISVSLMSIYKGLKPTVIDRLGLTSAIESHLLEVKQQTGLKIFYKLDRIGRDGMQKEAALGIYRILQESMSNVAKHSQATEVNVSLICGKEMVALMVTDNGIGIDLETEIAPDSIGMVSMKERAALLDGELRIVSAPGEGTTVALKAPIKDSCEET